MNNYVWGRDQLMVLCALRYCLGRSSYIVADCIEFLKAHFDAFDSDIQDLVKKEVEEFLEENTHVSVLDRNEWKAFLEYVKNE